MFSIEKIGNTALSACLSVAFLYFAANVYARDPTWVAASSPSSSSSSSSIFNLYELLIVAPFVFLVVDWYLEDKAYIAALMLPAMFIGAKFSGFVALRYFVKPLPAMFALLFIVSFSATLGASIAQAIWDMRNDQFSRYKNIRLIPPKDSPLANVVKNKTIIGMNSNFIFLYDKRQQTTIVISRSGIESIDVKVK